ncbi:1-aminocyclopropane-1-carboxylate deaminase/D-cysteine desulfhydrase [Fluviicola taffensis]|uniref:Pyridoxal-5'-phosphate-dependent protein beta subunit n=1 Tax=Fluviicola taffensis (strain DSM 16823 / NCIMB 13979 / RW262) TaxID=755732 RepID=F2IIJ6_FLUTR|nr:pyridoxal-phosphate dependent enzyme [Fluviicola taffensis]AEA45958.1 pyridoxal-5'-phosphate-dependent protein beta subunit [Fluviicola taffensis DSM 16823]
MELFESSKSILQEIKLDSSKFKNIRLLVKRDDLIHPEVSGNKWRKLKYNIELVQFQKKDGILTFGGAYSNHLLATAAACQLAGMKSIGIVRGEELTATSNDNLKRCSELGMELLFVPRESYDERNEKSCQEGWKEAYPSFLLIPEGGSNYYGLVGCQEIWKELPDQVDHLFVAQGTTTTSCGLLVGSNENTTLHVVPVLKGFDSTAEMRKQLFPFLIDEETITEYINRVEVHSESHFGGYGKWNQELIDFIQDRKAEFDLPLDKIYTGKAFYALMNWLEQQDFQTPQTVIFLHTGGLQNGSV